MFYRMSSNGFFDAALRDAGLMGAAVGLFAALRLAVAPVRRGSGERLLSLLLLLCAANIVHGLIDFRIGPQGPLFIEPLQFLLPLGLVWYLRSVQGKRLFHPGDAAQLALPLAFILASRLPGMLEARLPSRVPVFSLVMWLTMAASAALLLVPVAHGIARYRKSLELEYSNLAGIDPGWLRTVLILMGALFAVYAFSAGMMIHAPDTFPQRRLLAALMAAFTVVFAWNCLARKPTPVRGTPKAPAEEEPVERDLVAGGERIRGAVEARKLFKDPELSLDDLARAVGLTRHQASAVLNRGLAVTFFDLINGYRVAEFKRLCADPRWRDEKIMTLALEAGFNSKPAFNLVFKRSTGKTPSQYRKEAEIGSHPTG